MAQVCVNKICSALGNTKSPIRGETNNNLPTKKIVHYWLYVIVVQKHKGVIKLRSSIKSQLIYNNNNKRKHHSLSSWCKYPCKPTHTHIHTDQITAPFVPLTHSVKISIILDYICVYGHSLLIRTETSKKKQSRLIMYLYILTTWHKFRVISYITKHRLKN